MSALLLLPITAFLVWFLMPPEAPFQDPTSTVLSSPDGELLGAHIARDGQWRFPPDTAVPEKFAIALVQFEDRAFHRHAGIHPPALLRAFLQNRRAGRVVSGGSTITMQLARMAADHPDRSYLQKLQEMLVALRLEWHYDKQELLAMYASNAPFGGNVVGLDAAAWRYFGRGKTDLSWAEAAMLAVLPNAPSAIHPGREREALRRKRDRLLDRLFTIHALDSLELVLAKAEPLADEVHDLPRSAPHLQHHLMAHGYDGQAVVTTIDPGLQGMVTGIAARHGDVLAANGVYNAAVIVAEVATGRVLAYMGNLPDAGAEHAGAVDIVQAPRSTGSLLKPFLFAAMMESGELLPDMLVADIPTFFAGFTPRNYDGRYLGAVPASEALARSLNIPAVRALRAHGIPPTLGTLHGLGLASIDRTSGHYGLSLMIGGAESSLWELTGAYASLMRIAMAAPDPEQPNGTPKVVFQLQVVDMAAPPEGTSAPFGPGAAYATLRALEKVDRPGSDAQWQRFVSRYPISWKTGTSQGQRDAWAIGCTPGYVVGVWTGNADGEGRPGLTGGLAAAPLLFEVFDLLPYAGPLDPPFDDLAPAAICRASGYRAGERCVPIDSLRVPVKGLRTPLCPYHIRISVDEVTGLRVPPGPGSVLVERFVLPPAMERYMVQNDPSFVPLPPYRDPAHRVVDDQAMELIYPTEGAHVLVPTELSGERGSIVFEAAHRDPSTTLHWHLDGEHLGSTTGMHTLRASPPVGFHTLTLVDASGRDRTSRFTVISGHTPP